MAGVLYRYLARLLMPFPLAVPRALIVLVVISQWWGPRRFIDLYVWGFSSSSSSPAIFIAVSCSIWARYVLGKKGIMPPWHAMALAPHWSTARPTTSGWKCAGRRRGWAGYEVLILWPRGSIYSQGARHYLLLLNAHRHWRPRELNHYSSPVNCYDSIPTTL